MDEILLTAETKLPETVPEVYLGTVESVSSAGVELTLDGQAEPMQKKYRMLQTGQTLQTGARVMCIKISGTYVVLGAIGNPAT